MSLARDLGVNISGIAVILQMRERMEEMQRKMQEFVNFIGKEVMARRESPDPARGAIVPIRRTAVPEATTPKERKR